MKLYIYKFHVYRYTGLGTLFGRKIHASKLIFFKNLFKFRPRKFEAKMQTRTILAKLLVYYHIDRFKPTIPSVYLYPLIIRSGRAVLI